MRVRSKCDWYEYSEKSLIFFFNLEKSGAAQSTIRNITKDKNLVLVKEYAGLIKECYEVFFEDLKTPLTLSFK